jgi:hypothetical protein
MWKEGAADLHLTEKESHIIEIKIRYVQNFRQVASGFHNCKSVAD